MNSSGVFSGRVHLSLVRIGSLPLLVAWFVAPPARGDDGPPTYERDVRPLLVKRCTVCHNARKVDDPDISAGLALDSYDAAIKGTKAHPVVVAGKADASELIKRLSDPDDDLRMPLSDKPLSASEQALLRRWVEAGAPRGEPVAAAAPAGPRPKRRVVRSLDVVVPVELKVPGGVEGLGAGGSAELVLKVGPLPSVTALAFRGDGRLLAVGTHGAVVAWDLVDGRPARVLAGQPGPVHALAFSRDGRRLAVGSGLPARSGVVRVYDMPGGTLLHEFEGHGDIVYGLSFRPDGGQLASASFDQTVRLWDLGLGRPAGVFRGHSDFVYDVAYDRDGRTLLSAGKDRSVKRIDVARLKELRTYSDHNDDVLALAVPPGGGKFVTAGNEPQLRWWSGDGEKPTQRISGHGGPVHQLAFSGDGTRLISAGGDGTVRLWDGRTGAFQKSLAGPTDWQYAVALSGDGALAAAGGWDGLVRVWAADPGQLRATLLQPPADDPDTVEWLAVAPSGYVAASPPLARLARWRVGGKEVPGAGDSPMSAFARPDALAQSLRGETVPPAFK
jgi:hypothetical protein